MLHPENGLFSVPPQGIILRLLAVVNSLASAFPGGSPDENQAFSWSISANAVMHCLIEHATLDARVH